jgi:hypothetical protein
MPTAARGTRRKPDARKRLVLRAFYQADDCGVRARRGRRWRVLFSLKKINHRCELRKQPACAEIPFGTPSIARHGKVKADSSRAMLGVPFKRQAIPRPEIFL